MQFCYLVIITILIVVKLNVSTGATCRQTNDHKNYTCNGMRIKQFTVSRNSRPQFLRAWIYNCKTTHIQEEALYFPNLENATLSCDIETLHENAFRNLNRLQELNLGNNTISALPDHLFQSLSELRTLNLSKNNFEELTKTMFDGLNNLKELILSYNAISKLDYKALGKTAGLEKIYLNNNQIRIVPNTFFSLLRKLQFADLSHNNIENINGLFVFTYSLTNLNISHNAIKDLESRLFQTTSLKILDLSYNELTIIYEDTLKLDTLQELYLQDNKIFLFDVKGIGLLKFPLSFLDVRYNRLVFLEDDFIKMAQNLITLRVDGNPWDCECYFHTEALRGEIGLDVGPEYQLGEQPLCVFGNSDKCDINRNNLTYYYNLYQEGIEPRR